jgi:hypothetical protein
MSELGDIMGDDFEEEYQEKRSRRREEASKVDKPTLMEICYEAINNGGFKGEEPRFRFSGDSVDHDVLLMESPDDDLETFRWPLGDTAKTQGMFHVDELFSLAFQENMLDLLSKIETGEYYLVVGRYEERTETDSNGNEETYYNINPVRGIVPLSVGKKYADQYEDQMEGSSPEEQAEQQQSESSDDSDSDIDLSDADDSSVSDDEIVQIFHAVGDKAADLLQSVVYGDSTSIDKLVTVTNNNLDGEADRERILDLFEEKVDNIDGRGEEEDDDDLDLGGLGDDSDDEEEVPAPTDGGGSDTSSESSDDDGDSSDPSDWF